MQYKTFTISQFNSDSSEIELNSFLRTNKIISVEKSFSNTPHPTWYFLVEYIENQNQQSVTGTITSRKNKIDYMQILSAQEFAVFSKLRDFRKKQAKEEQVPPYVIFTDAELASLVKAKITEVEQLKEVKDVKIQKIEKYGTELLKILTSHQEEEKSDEKTEIPF